MLNINIQKNKKGDVRCRSGHVVITSSHSHFLQISCSISLTLFIACSLSLSFYLLLPFFHFTNSSFAKVGRRKSYQHHWQRRRTIDASLVGFSMITIRMKEKRKKEYKVKVDRHAWQEGREKKSKDADGEEYGKEEINRWQIWTFSLHNNNGRSFNILSI